MVVQSHLRGIKPKDVSDGRIKNGHINHLIGIYIPRPSNGWVVKHVRLH